MFKFSYSYLFLILLLIFSLIPFSVIEAHSTLDEAIPREEEKLKDSIDTVTLTFSTKIENGSKLSLVKENGEEIQPSSINLDDNLLEATFDEPLLSGTYQVNWKIIGADGHPIENQYSFSIVGAEDNPTPSEDEQNRIDESGNNPEQSETVNDNQQTTKATKNKDSDESQTNIDEQPSSFVNGIILFLIIAGIVLLSWLMVSKRKK